ncbi:mediator of RNA polymerase II transcription subunit 12 isoform X1 [Aedes albopictus]|uniref:BAT2 N-terminal domain-containing protein n=1 Tax=Aedes albopictus TaxID=7160 RepID=A0ABM1ZIJ4_AEDAL
MNALGGTRGERNAKPKFAALDINKLYSTSRGESLEPSTQKSAAPRKHGMQSLGKVPSARRPPANLPSLKAEISIPSDQQGTWGSEAGDTQNNNSSITSSSVGPSAAAGSSTNNNASVGAGGVHTTSHASSPQIPHSSTSSSSQWSSNEFPSLDGTGQYGPSGKQQHHHHHDGIDGRAMGQYMDGPQVSLRPQTDAASWMQQQQQSSGGGNNAGGMNGPNSSQQGQGPQQQPAAPLPPQFRALMPPFMYRGNGGGGGNSVTPPPSNEDISRGNIGSGGGGNGGGGGGGMRNNNSNMGYNSMLPSFVAPPTNHHQSHGSSYSPTQSGGRYRDSYSGGRRGQMQPPRLANRQQQHQHEDHRSQPTAPAYVEPDILVQRPIIRDEELQRIEAIAKDEGWAKDDEIDYNQKLQFSDDESEPSPPKEIPMPVVKQEKSPPQVQQQQQQIQQQQQQQQSQQEDDKRMAWSREVEREQERLEQERIERIERERQEREREQSAVRPVQQNGHIGGRGLDAEAKERLKQRREEDQRREMERKQAAARKLQELEQKLSRKKNEDGSAGSAAPPAATKEEEDRDQLVTGFNESGESKERSTSSVRGGDRERGESKEYRDRDRDRFDYGRHDRDYRDRDRGERDRAERDRTERPRGEQDRDRDAWGEAPPYSKNFQSNLPPRFQKRKLERNPSGNSLQGSGSYMNRDQNISRNSSTANQGPMVSQSQQQSESKSVPFAQQYDPRFIHSQQNYGKSQSSGPARRPAPGEDNSRGRDLRDRGDDRDSLTKDREQQRERGEMIPREIMKRRIDSEEDDRFSSSGRESSSKLSGGRTTPQLVRSVSDTSQRKTSVSSDDNNRQMDHHHHHNSSREIIGSWESETEKEDRRQAEAAAALAKENQLQQLQLQQQQSENRRISESSLSEGEPKQILQRIKESSPALHEESSKSRNDETKANEPKLLTTAWEETVEAAEEAQLKASEASSTSIEDKKDVSNSDMNKSDSGKSIDQENKMSIDSGKEMDDGKYGSKKPMQSRGGGRHEPRGGGHSRGGFSGSSGFHRGGSSGSWGRRGGPGGARMGHGRNYNQDYWSESDYSDDGDEEFRKDGKYERKEGMGSQYRNSGSSVGQSQNMKEGFAPRGEPSRRGRGGMSTAMSGPGFRKTTVGKKMDGYGPPSSKSPFGSSEEKAESKSQSAPKDMKPTDQTLSADDRTKQKQAALSAGLTNKPIGGPKPPTSGPLPQRSPSGNMKPPGKPAEETLSDQEKLKASLEKKTRNDSKSESHDEKMKEKQKTESESHDTDDASKDSQKSGQPRPKQQQPPGIKAVQPSTTAPVVKATTTTPKPTTVVPSGATPTGPKPTAPAAPGMQQAKPNQDARAQANNRSMNMTPRMVKPKERRDGGFQDGQLSGGEVNESEANVVASSQQQPVQEKVNTLNVNSLKTDNSKQHLDGATPPVNTIIFENTNYKSSTSVVSTVQQQHLHQQQQQQQPQQPLQIQMQQQQQQLPQAPSAQAQIKRQHSGGVPGQLMALHQQQQQQQQQLQHQQQQMVQMVKQDHVVRHPSQEDAFKVAAGVPQAGSMHDIMEQQQQPPQRPQSANGPQQQQPQPQQQQQLQQNQVPLQQQIPQQQQPSSQADVITSALHNMAFPKPAEADYDKEMKPFTFDADISQLIEAKNKAAGLCLPKAQNMISPSTAELNMKIASVKKVWEMPSVPEHVTEDPSSAANAAAAAVQLAANFAAVNSQHQHQQHLHQFQHSHSNLSHAHQAHTLAAAAAAGQSYAGAFGQDQQSLDQHFNKANNESVVIGGTGGGNDGDNSYNNPQHAVVGQGNNVQHQAAANMNMKHDVLANNVNVCKVKPTQQNMHQSTGLGLSPPPMQQGTIPSAPQTYFQPSQYGMSAIPSPPAVIYNSSAISQGGLYNAFQLEAANRSQFSQFPGHYGTTGTGPYNAYMTTPPNLQTAPTPEMYPSLTSQFRMGGAVQSPYNPSPSQQMNNPSTMLISSSTNSLMSSSVKPSSQQIGAIGSKSGSVGQPYGQQYMGMFQPAPPLQNNSYYSNSAGGQSAFFGGAGATQNYGIPAAAAAGMFGGHGAQTPSNAPPPQQQLPNYPNASQFLNTPLALAANAISQQYRGGPTTNPQSAAAAAAYMKGNQPQSHMQDPNGRQLKSPLNSDGMNNLKQIPPQASPPHHKGYAAAWELQLQQQQQQNQHSNQQQQPPQQQNPQQHPQQQMNQPPQSQQPNPNRNMMPPNQQPPAGLGGAAGGVGGRPPQGVQGGGMPQRYPSPIQRPTNYSQAPVPGMHQQRPIRQSGGHNPGQQQQANMAQAMGNPNKHYYGGNRGGGHVNAMNEQNLGGKPGGANDKPVMDGDVNKDDSKKK